MLYYRKIPKIISGAYIFQRPFLRGLYSEGNLRFKIGKDKNLYIFVLFCFVFEGDCQVQDARGAYIRRDDFTEDFLRYKYGGLYLEGLNFGILRYFPENLRC